MNVELLDCMGTDLTVVNSARVSFNKESRELNDKDKKLIIYLAINNHWTPFCHCFLSFRIKAPIFVARQLAKHQVGLTWNEVSRRYVKSNPEFYTTNKYRRFNENVKQGSSREMVNIDTDMIDRFLYESKSLYNNLIDLGICPEQARMILPLSLYTEWIWSGSLFAFARVCKLRMKQETQEETRGIANMINNIVIEKFPISWNALLGVRN